MFNTKYWPIYAAGCRTVLVSTSFGVGSNSVFWGLWTSAIWIVLEVHWFLAKELFKKDSPKNETKSN